jgi:hypothetical protein
VQPCRFTNLPETCSIFGVFCTLADSIEFIIVPKCGKDVVHFLQRSPERANKHHNFIFDHNNLSHEALYARFAWAVMKVLNEAQLCSKWFKFLEAEGNNQKEARSE